MPFPDTQTAMAVADRRRPASSHDAPCAALADTLMAMGTRLGIPRLVVAVVAIGNAPTELSPGEQTQLRRLRAPGRRRSWLAGRAALKAARRNLESGTDTSDLRFPDPCTSLTHTAGFAVAVAVPRGATSGLGIDLESRHETSPETTRYFLTDGERDWLERQPLHHQSDERIRLWAVKEAVYKACPKNHDLTLRRIELRDPAAAFGMVAEITRTANRATFESDISYTSEWTPAGCLSLAQSPNRHRRAISMSGRATGRKQ